jgi:branched-chain amino acid transport system permease protein
MNTFNAKAVGRTAFAVALFLVAVQATFHLTVKYYLNGIALGSLYGIIGVAIILIYRTNRIINFAAAAVGACPAIFALLLVLQKHWSYVAALPIAMIGGPLAGLLTDVIAMRRFSRSPRLITTVVTIGVAQSWAALGFFIPVWMGARAGQISIVPTPWQNWKILNGRGEPVLTGDQVFAIAVVIVLTVGLALFLRYTRMGIALRASAENADRALLLGIPVRRVGTIAWMIAGLLSAMCIYVQSPLIGVPGDATLGFTTLLYGMAAAVVARMERIGVALAAGMAIGVLIFASVYKTGANDFASALMLAVILGALLLQRKSMARALDAGTSTWETVKQFRPIPRELRSLREVETARIALYALAVLVAVGAPFVLGRADMPLLIVLPLFGIVAVSLVVLTGWAGQMSLGQFGLVGAGAAAAGGLIADHNIDFFLAIALGVAAGVLVAVLIGLPAIRIQGLYLAVTTLAFGYAMQYYFLNSHYWIGKHLLPNGFTAHLRRPMLYGSIDLENDRAFYFVCIVFLALVIAAAITFRRTRSGRVLIAARDNQRAAPAYAINLVRARLAAFAISGGIAGLAGVLFAYSQHNVIPGTYSVEASIAVFLAATIGGLTSVPFAVMGTISFEAFVLFGPRFYQHLGDTFVSVVPLLLTGPLLVLNLYFYPGGSAEAGFATRDKFLRKLAAKYQLLVPSLVADRRVDELDRTGQIVVEAEASVELQREEVGV